MKKIIMIAGGLLTGLAGGFFGGGGGMLAVPLLDKGVKLPTKESHATAMLVILPMSIASAATYFARNIIDLKSTLITGGGVLVGGIIGAVLLKKLNSFIIAIAFAVIMIVAGARLTFF